MTTRPLVAIVVGFLVVVSWIGIAATDFDQDVQVAFGTVCAGLTVTMVFVLQHTQRREQIALQLKVDELIRVLPQADDRLIGVEASSDDAIVEIVRSHQGQHAALRDDVPLYVPGGNDESATGDSAERTLARVNTFTPDGVLKGRRKWPRR
jgi:low affinity Fe/Cu permease